MSHKHTHCESHPLPRLRLNTLSHTDSHIYDYMQWVTRTPASRPTLSMSYRHTLCESPASSVTTKHTESQGLPHLGYTQWVTMTPAFRPTLPMSHKHTNCDSHPLPQLRLNTLWVTWTPTFRTTHAVSHTDCHISDYTHCESHGLPHFGLHTLWVTRTATFRITRTESRGLPT
jgi:hypothetical protein